jgi:hypothetical protein
MISIYDALVLRDGGTLTDAGKRYSSYSVDHAREIRAGSRHKFTGSTQDTPVAPLHEVLRLLAIIPGPGAARTRTQTKPGEHQVVQEQRQSLSAMTSNPVNAVQLMQLGEDDLRAHCRITEDRKVSIIDALALRDRISTVAAGTSYNHWLKRGSETGLDQHADIVSKHQFADGIKPTPVAPLHEVLRLLAIIPGPGAARVRSQQADLTTRAMAGDWDLQQAIQDRRQALPAAAQELFLAGLESSSDAKRMREEQHEEETKAPKRARLSYTGEQLIDFVKDLCPAGPPNPDLLSQMWEQSDGTHEDFMAKYIKYCEVRTLVLRACVKCPLFFISLSASNHAPSILRGSKAFGRKKFCRSQATRTSDYSRAQAQSGAIEKRVRAQSQRTGIEETTVFGAASFTRVAGQRAV